MLRYNRGKKHSKYNLLTELHVALNKNQAQQEMFIDLNVTVLLSFTWAILPVSSTVNLRGREGRQRGGRKTVHLLRALRDGTGQCCECGESQ